MTLSSVLTIKKKISFSLRGLFCLGDYGDSKTILWNCAAAIMLALTFFQESNIFAAHDGLTLEFSVLFMKDSFVQPTVL